MAVMVFIRGFKKGPLSYSGLLLLLLLLLLLMLFLMRMIMINIFCEDKCNTIDTKVKKGQTKRKLQKETISYVQVYGEALFTGGAETLKSHGGSVREATY